MKWIIAILIFSLLIIFHELGHFLAARLNGVEVLEFSLGFGPRILSAEYHGTRYSLKLLLFGGSCRMKGMAEAYLDEDNPVAAEPGSFQAASLPRRAAIIFAGPFFNFILAFICAVVITSVVGFDPAVVNGVTAGSEAEAAGLKVGDVITSYNGRKVSIARDYDLWDYFYPCGAGEPVTIRYRRDGASYEAVFTPEVLKQYMFGITYASDGEQVEILEVAEDLAFDRAGIRAGDILTSVEGTEITTPASFQEYINEHPIDGSTLKVIVERAGREYEYEVTPTYVSDYVRKGYSVNYYREKTGGSAVLYYSLVDVRYQILSAVEALKSLFRGRLSVNDLSGPVGVVNVVGETYERAKSEGPLLTLMNMLNMILLLSANLGVMNLLPIPAIDGGRLLFLFIEAVRGRPVDRKVEMAVQTVAALLLLLLMVYVMYHDVTMLFDGGF